MIKIIQLCLFVFSLTSPAVYAYENQHEHQQSTEKMAVEVLSYINQYRAQRHLPPLTMDKTATLEAIRHSQEMAHHQVPFGHHGFEKRMQHVYHAVPDARGGAENVAYNYKTAKIVVDGWIKSPGHHRNIIGRYHLTGIGIVRDRAGKLYFTQLFVHTEPHAEVHQHNGRFFIG